MFINAKIYWYFCIRFILIFLVPFFYLACEAPRSNPLDPGSITNPNLAILEGTIQTFSIPYSPLADVSVYWEPGSILVKTDENGNFNINNILPADGFLIVQKKGYSSDTSFVEWQSSRKITRQINLNKIPVLDSISVYTVVVNQMLPVPVYELNFVVRISDRDNDIDSVYLQDSVLNLKRRLEFNDIERTYKLSLSISELNVSDLEETIAHDFNIYVNDLFDRRFNIGSGRVSRIIKNQVSIISPANEAIVDSMPELKWGRFLPGYEFNYMIEIYINDIANTQRVQRIAGISSDTTSYRLLEPLPKKEYYWVVWIIDKLNNKSRSVPATFIVQ